MTLTSRLRLALCAFFLLPIATALAAPPDLSIYTGFAYGTQATQSAAVLSGMLGDKLKRPVAFIAHAGDAQRVALKAVLAEVPGQRRLFYAGASPELDLSGLKHITSIGWHSLLALNFDVYGNKSMTDAEVAELREAISAIVMSGKLPHVSTQTPAALAMTNNPTAAREKVTAQSSLRQIEVPGKTITVPGGSFSETSKVEKFCMPDSVRPPIIDGANRNYLREAEFRQVMQLGRRVAEASDRWGRALGYTTLVQRELPGARKSDNNLGITLTQEMIDKTDYGNRPRPRPTPPPPPQQADLDYNFAVLNATQAEIETAAESYYADLDTLALMMLNELDNAGRPAAEMFALLRKIDGFMQDNLVCFNERVLGVKVIDKLGYHGWPMSNAPRTRTPEWWVQNARGGKASKEVNVTFERLAALAISATSPGVLPQIQGAKSASELRAVMQSAFGEGRIHELALKDGRVGAAFTNRSAAIVQEEKRVQEALERKRKLDEERRIAAKFKTNGSPDLADIQKMIVAWSLEDTMAAMESNDAAKGKLTSPTAYVIYATFAGQDWKMLEANLSISDLSCRAVARMQSCTYTQSFGWTEYKMFEKIVLPRGTKQRKVTGNFEWTATGLRAAGKKGPSVDSIGYVSNGASASGGNNGNSPGQELQEAFQQRDRDNYQNFMDRNPSSVHSYNPQKTY